MIPWPLSKKRLSIISWKLHNTAAICHFILTLIGNQRVNKFPNELIAKSLFGAIEDAVEFLEISSGDFFDLALQWPQVEEKLFKSTINKREFYGEWKEDLAASNICANIINQHFDMANFAAVAHMFSYETAPVKVLDFGCGTASLSLGLKLNGILPAPLNLVDVDNDVSKFINYRIDKHKLSTSVSFSDVSSISPETKCSQLICIDVLEHLEHSSSIFSNQIDPLLLPGGYIYLVAPWLGHITHLTEAMNNFYGNGGRKFLKKKYKFVKRVKAMDVAGIWKKHED